MLQPGKPLAKTRHPSGRYVEAFTHLSASADGRFVTGVVADGGRHLDCHFWDLRQPNVPSQVVERLPLGCKSRIVHDSGLFQVFDDARVHREASVEHIVELGLHAALAASAGRRHHDPAASSGRFFDGSGAFTEPRLVRRDMRVAHQIRGLDATFPLAALPIDRVEPIDTAPDCRRRVWRSGPHIMLMQPSFDASPEGWTTLVLRATRKPNGSTGPFELVDVRSSASRVELLSPDGRYLFGHHGRSTGNPRAGEPFVTDCWGDFYFRRANVAAGFGPFDGDHPHTLAAFAPDARSLLVAAAPGRNAAGSRGSSAWAAKDLTVFEGHAAAPETRAQLFDLARWGESGREVIFDQEADLCAIGLLPNDRVVAQRANEGVLLCAELGRLGDGFVVALPSAAHGLP